uniref:DNA primase n=1 Tax=Angiostrongylus cantonensis TaxID=6313 RepID=A0A158P9F9_ANGCA
MSLYDSSLLDQFLPQYYKRIFPFKPFVKWLCYNRKPEEYFAKREFAFILEGDVHLRYRSFDNPAEFENELCKISPHKLDIGAFYSHKPKDNKKYSDFKAVERELVFDIDLTDYGSVRKCCSEAKVCEKCWRFISVAVQVLDKLLEEPAYSALEHFGFKARMWVFSGRRGVHCWVGDEKARKLTNAGRSAVAEYLSLIVIASDLGKNFLRWFVLWHTYPRLDVNVSTVIKRTNILEILKTVLGLNHLLKSPFCIHPKTGNVAVPLDVGKISQFDVSTCPRVDTLINELSKVLVEEHVKENRKLLGYKHTSLAPYVENFEKFIELAALA